MTATERRHWNRINAELNAHRAAATRELQAVAMQIVSDLRAEDLADRVIRIAATEVRPPLPLLCTSPGSTRSHRSRAPRHRPSQWWPCPWNRGSRC